MTTGHHLRATVFAITVATLTTSAHAGIQLGDAFTLTGFGTLGAVQTDSDESMFVRGTQFKGADRSASLLVDSNLGLQLTGKANDWLSGTVQVLAAQRQAETSIKAEVEWAFVKVEPMEGLALRAGRMPLATFAISDSRNVGYANTWVRPPNEVYSLSILNRLTGGDASYRWSLGSSSLNFTAAAGKSEANPVAVDLKLDNVRNVSVTWEGDGISVRASRLKARVLLGFLNQPDDFYTFTGIGMVLDRNDVVGQAEYVTRRSSHQAELVDADAWYVLGGYRFGAWTPYLSYAKAKKDDVTPTALTGPQTTVAVGARWDAFSSAAIKFQLERIDTKGTQGASFHSDFAWIPGVPIPVHKAVTKPVHAFSVAVDFVF